MPHEGSTNGLCVDGVSYEQFRDAWAPENDDDAYPAVVSVGRSVTNDRQVITILEVDVAPEKFASVAGSLTRPDALQRLAEIVESTELEGVYEQVVKTDGT